MKPANFPGRKNDRRKGALKRLKGDGAKKSLEQQVLTSRILPDSVARSARTKKDRSARGKLRT